MRSKCKPCDEKRKYKRFVTKRYGITTEEYNTLALKQDYCCAICRSSTPNNKRTDKLFVDHDHKTGKVRGLLCSKCNHALGQFNDNPDLLLKAISYLTDRD